MPDIDVRITDLNSRVSLCTAYDVVENESTITLRRAPVATCWAKIYALPHLPSFIGGQFGYAVKETAERITHWITLRAGIGLDFTSSAWVYEERRKSPPRWYKMLGFYDNGNWVVLHCHLVERSINAVPPKGSPLEADQVEI